LGYQPCPSQGKLCYHALAGVLVAFADKGYQVAFAKEPTGLKRLKSIHMGSVIYIAPFVQSGSACASTVNCGVYALVYKKVEKPVSSYRTFVSQTGVFEVKRGELPDDKGYAGCLELTADKVLTY
jgi:hypothetical protein